jgi:predicted AlkP superfamily pyrophosphatase or phosphodiesterase
MVKLNVNQKARIVPKAIIFFTVLLLSNKIAFPQKRPPNIVLIITDQFRADACKREGFKLDTTPFLDSLAQTGTWFNKAYCSSPACVPSRTSMMTGRFPNATRVRSNMNLEDDYYKEDFFHRWCSLP